MRRRFPGRLQLRFSKRRLSSLVSTVRRWLYLRRDDRLWLSLNHALLLIGRKATGRDASPSAGVIDSQSVKSSKSGGPREVQLSRPENNLRADRGAQLDANYSHVRKKSPIRTKPQPPMRATGA